MGNFASEDGGIAPKVRLEQMPFVGTHLSKRTIAKRFAFRPLHIGHQRSAVSRLENVPGKPMGAITRDAKDGFLREKFKEVVLI
ncbi:hypothetical protein JX265_012734 [Neoarthrinium moseri]|uniref:Uncharacterized protein n=1 Tax=Neoarthrinium moseri TaxID=1658444 RepID=A0A9Q0AJA0_9PEZI|nr:hypothetical protein JX265_012734 [Neoarthrinium moseri]